MKALSLTQPWATLIAIGAKRVETRSWYTHHTGKLAIHATKGFPGWAKQFSREPPVSVLLGPDYQYPHGVVVCIVNILSCLKTEQVRPALRNQELAFGDYSDGRFAWSLQLVEKFDEPIIATGHQGLWNWVPPWHN